MVNVRYKTKELAHCENLLSFILLSLCTHTSTYVDVAITMTV
jgi:hypothetical protein